MITFEVKKESLETVRTLIKEFVWNIRKNEPATLVYTAWQEKEHPRRFIHLMTFSDEQAQKIHREADYVKAFTDQLYPECTAEPKFVELNHLISK